MTTNQFSFGEDSVGNERRFLLGLKQLQKEVIWFAVLFLALISIYPRYTIAQSLTTDGTTTAQITQELPALLPKTIVRSVILTAYTSAPEETDDTPFVTASGKPTGDGIAAANFLPFGTKFRVPALFGNKVFVIEDRMHPRMVGYVDIWVPTKAQAYKIGIRKINIEIVADSMES
jgi:3D (Asp-Asp-Asp) domain-containing protein